MNVVIAGTRTFDNYALLEAVCDSVLSGKHVDAILCGECRGADVLGRQYAERHGIAVESYPAEWKLYGRSAGVRRNKQMAEHADLLIAFWDGKSRGTANMIKLMRNKETYVHMI